MTTRRAFLESLGLALGVGVVAKAAVSRSERVQHPTDHVYVNLTNGQRMPAQYALIHNGRKIPFTCDSDLPPRECVVLNRAILRRIATTSQRVRVP